MTIRTSLLLAGTLAGIATATAAVAGDTVIYQPAPAWVEAKPLAAADKDGPAIALLDQQVRMADGVVSTYQDRAIRLATPAALTQFGTITAQWLPDKGDLIVHRAELIRDGKVIDLLANGAKFDVLRREQQLEQRIVNGARTASLVVPGAQLGDILRIAYTVTVKDQALGSQMQSTSALVAKPIPLETGGLTVSWPAGTDVRWKAVNGPDDIAVQSRGDERFVHVDLPLPKPADMPDSAPTRYTMTPIFQATTYADWQSVSSAMAKVFAAKIGLPKDGPLAQQVAAIEAKSSDPVTRAALATQLVQDKIGYLLNGMQGGNYIPQAPGETWQKRFGDCKAKTVLLLSLLKAMGIEAEPLLVSTTAGDALPVLLPMPGDFDHVIAHATIGGKDYWLDGTNTGTRPSNVATVPAFFYGLPLRQGGADLLHLTPRLPQAPTQKMTLTLDSRAGVSVPTLYDIDFALSGGTASAIRAATNQLEGAQLRSAVGNMVSNVLGNSEVTDASLTYDEESGFAHVKAKGILTSSPWSRKDEVFELAPPATPVKQVGFDTDRARAAWRDIPLKLNGPLYQDYTLKVLLPDDGKGYAMEGDKAIDTDIAGVAIHSDARLAGSAFTLDQSVRSAAGELAAKDIPAAARTDATLTRKLPKIDAPGDARMDWQYQGADRKLLAPVEQAFAGLIANAEPDDVAGDYAQRATFRSNTGDLAGAESDLDTAIEKAASVDLFYQRAGVRRDRGDWTGALADYQQAESLENKGNSYNAQIIMLGLLGRPQDALTAADDYAAIADKPSDAKSTEATALMWAGERDKGIAMLQELLKRRPGDPDVLNNLCWQSGIWNMVTKDTIDACDSAVAKSDWSANALDSRAMAYFRQGDLKAAKGDYDAALASNPWQTQSRYMRGVVRVAMGDAAGGRQDIANALATDPGVAKEFAAYGIKQGG